MLVKVFCHPLLLQVQGTCLSAHSLLERDVWMLERDTDITREQLVEQSQRFAAAGSFQQQYFQKQQQVEFGKTALKEENKIHRR